MPATIKLVPISLCILSVSPNNKTEKNITITKAELINGYAKLSENLVIADIQKDGIQSESHYETTVKLTGKR